MNLLFEMSESSIENYYSGEANWQKFAALFVDEWSTCQFQNELVSALDNDQEIAMVIYGSVQQNALQWIDKPIPALNNAAPRECMETEDGRKRLKTMLMRMPR